MTRLTVNSSVGEYKCILKILNTKKKKEVQTFLKSELSNPSRANIVVVLKDKHILMLLIYSHFCMCNIKMCDKNKKQNMTKIVKLI